MLENWFKRHRHSTSLKLHLIGIPLTILAIPAVVIGVNRDASIWYWLAAGLVIAGYALQFVGHSIEGNDAGETIIVKKLLGKPYIAVVEPENSKSSQKS